MARSGLILWQSTVGSLERNESKDYSGWKRSADLTSGKEQMTMDMYEEKAKLLIEQLIGNGIVEMPPEESVLVHVPTGARFESAQNLAHYHRGWEANSQDQSTG